MVEVIESLIKVLMHFILKKNNSYSIRRLNNWKEISYFIDKIFISSILESSDQIGLGKIKKYLLNGYHVNCINIINTGNQDINNSLLYFVTKNNIKEIFFIDTLEDFSTSFNINGNILSINNFKPANILQLVMISDMEINLSSIKTNNNEIICKKLNKRMYNYLLKPNVLDSITYYPDYIHAQIQREVMKEK